MSNTWQLIGVAAMAVAAEGGQVHVAFGKTVSELSVAWATASGGGTSVVKYGLKPDELTRSATGDSRAFTEDVGRTWYTRTAMMTGLTEATKYYYQVGDDVNGYSDVFSVTNRRTEAPFKHVLFGDMGSTASFTLCKACTQNDQVCDAARCAGNTSVGLVSEVDTADMFLHVGDFAYDLGQAHGTIGDYFFENIEQIAAKVPYMVSHGNHEDSPINLAHFLERFRSQPSNAIPETFTGLNGETTNTLYYSWDYGLVHYIGFSTEFWHGVESKDPVVNATTFLAWLEDDLKKANANRDQFPWIVAHGHRPLYTSADQYSADPLVKAALEPLFFKYGVDFSVNGHQHNYERSYPLYNNKSTPSYMNPGATIYVVSGAAGSKEMHTPFQFPQPAWCAFRANHFSYTRMAAYNATHMHFEQVATDPTDLPGSEYGQVIDEFWVVQNSHGPFTPDRAPTTTPAASCPSCVTLDHFESLLPELADGSGRPLHARIREFRAKKGTRAWMQLLQRVMDHMNRNGGGFIWEDGNLDSEELEVFNELYSTRQGN